MHVLACQGYMAFCLFPQIPCYRVSGDLLHQISLHRLSVWIQPDIIMSAPQNLLPIHTSKGADKEDSDIGGQDTPGPTMVPSHFLCTKIKTQADSLVDMGWSPRSYKSTQLGSPSQMDKCVPHQLSGLPLTYVFDHFGSGNPVNRSRLPPHQRIHACPSSRHLRLRPRSGTIVPCPFV